MKTTKPGQKQKRMRFNLVYLKTQIKRLYTEDKQKALLWFHTYKSHGGTQTLKQIVGDEKGWKVQPYLLNIKR